ncbi:MAG: hypothetical protein CME63_12905 [Halobacteriovoraceae bacterium]|nr:hypothetical protein [Halobacteriovoraceae bacterium]
MKKSLKKYFASCPRGLEETLYKEIEKYEYEHIEITRGGISFKTDTAGALGLLFESRVASRVYKEIGSFQFMREKEIYEAAKQIPWTKIMHLEQTLKVGCIISREVKSRFKNSHHLSLVLKDAIVDRFKDEEGSRPDVDIDDADYSFLLRIEPDPKKGLKGIVMLDMAGFSLHQRGYRKIGHEAPIKENLAAGLIMNTKWDSQSPLYDIFCGSGTFLIEAAMITFQMAPTYLKLKQLTQGHKAFAFQAHRWFQNDEAAHTIFRNLVSELITKSEQGRKSFKEASFIGSDKDRRVFPLVEHSWRVLGLPKSQLKTFHSNALTVYPQKEHKKGFLITTPPYGVRLEEKSEELEKMYHEMGENLKKNWSGFDCYLINEDASLRKKISLRTESRFTFWNGPLECRLLNYNIY